ncbi:MAG: FtsX-like permease family protein [Gemmatimonadales bacterium]|jgi:putative ABC transport system permease protein
MSNALSLGWRTLVRRPRRLVLFVAGVTVAAAVLLDMVMLAAGLQRSLLDLLEATGYQLRVVPKGLLPFESGAAIRDSDSLAALIAQDPRVPEAIPLWGQTLYVTRTDGSSEPLATFGYGAPLGTEPALRVRDGLTIERSGDMIVDRLVADHFGIALGDSLLVGLDPDPAAGSLRRRRAVRVTGFADFMFAPEGSPTAAVAIEDLWALSGTSNRPAAILLVRVAKDEDAYAVARKYRQRLTNVDVFALPEIIEAAGDRFTYFQQLSLVLGTVSLGVAFLLVGTLLTLSVNERWGEIAALRALGVTRGRMLAQVAWQGLIISASGTAVGLAVGLVVARYLDRILTSFPGLPLNVSFFVLEGRDALASVGLLVATGLLAGLYPAWRAASVNISAVLRQEIE